MIMDQFLVAYNARTATPVALRETDGSFCWRDSQGRRVTRYFRSACEAADYARVCMGATAYIAVG